MADKHYTTKYADLDKLSTETLKDIVRADLASDDLDDDYVMRALEVIEQREAQVGNTVDVDTAWETFCNEYCTKEGADQSLYDSSEPCDSVPAEKRQGAHKQPKTVRFVLKRIGLVAAVIALLLTGMVTVQAAGIDVFGAIARWTDEVFRFETPKAQVEEPHEEPTIGGISLDWFPVWMPEDFVLSESKMYSFDDWKAVLQSFCAEDGRYFDIEIKAYASPEYIQYGIYQKDDSPVEEYLSNGRTVYLFTNLDNRVAVCLDGLTEISVAGDLTTDELKQIFDSIGETS